MLGLVGPTLGGVVILVCGVDVERDAWTGVGKCDTVAVPILGCNVIVVSKRYY